MTEAPQRDAPPEPPRRSLPVALLVEMRPRQWVKNLSVAAPLLFAKQLLDRPQALRAAAAVGVFCLISSAVYLWNDLIDVEKDRTHPKKRFRPIAAGELPINAARALAAAFAVVGLALGWLVAPLFAAAVLTYLAKDVAYSLVLKRIPYVDVLSIASGFLLRVFAGALAIDVHASPWLLLCTGVAACFLGFGKRAHEMSTAGARAVAQRSVLAAYRAGHLRVALLITGVGTIVAYLCYTLAPHTREFFHTTRMVWTVPFIALGVGRFMTLVAHRPRAESPTEEMLRDPIFVANIALYVVAVVAIIYSAR